MKLSYCMLASIFILSSLFLCFMNTKKDIFIYFDSLLTTKQQVLYKKIIKERIYIYITGVILGICIAGFYYYKSKKTKLDICISICIIYLTKLVIYYISPKSPLLLYSLTNQKQVKAWADIYTEMKQRYIQSLLFGTIGYLFLFLR